MQQSPSQSLFFKAPGFTALYNRISKMVPASIGFFLALFTETLPCNATRHQLMPSLYPSPLCPICNLLDDQVHLLNCTHSSGIAKPPEVARLIAAGPISIPERFGVIHPSRIPALAALGIKLKPDSIINLALATLQYAERAWRSRIYHYRHYATP